MPLDQDKLQDVLSGLGEALRRKTRLCIIGSAPAILRGQVGRLTRGIDVWLPQSKFDPDDLARACTRAGLSYEAEGDAGPALEYLRVIQPSVVSLPEQFDEVELGRYGKLTVNMPDPIVVVAVKLARATVPDVDDVVWWIREKKLRLAEVEQAIERLPDPERQANARKHLVVARLVAIDGPNG